MAYADSIRSSGVTTAQIATLIEGIFSSGYGLTWTSWVPTYGASGSMTYTSVTTTFAKYIQVGKLVFYQIYASGTTGGTASNQITATLPVAGLSDSRVGSCIVQDGSGNITGQVFTNATNLLIYKYDTSNFGLGASRLFIAVGFYEAA